MKNAQDKRKQISIQSLIVFLNKLLWFSIICRKQKNIGHLGDQPM